MSDSGLRLAKDRAIREAALATFNANLAQVRNDLDARGIGGRIADKAGKEVRAGFDEALAIADDNKGIVAATIAALTLWLLRHPLIEGLQALLADGKAADAANPAKFQEAVLVSKDKPRRKPKEPAA
jgi:hypothetical protein